MAEAAAIDGGVPGATTPETATPPVDTSFTLDWRAALLDAEHRDSPMIRDFKDVNSLAKSYIHAYKRLSTSVEIPDSNAPPETLEAFYTKLGRPKDAAGYKYEASHLPEGVTLQKDFETRLREMAFEQGLNDKQFQGLVGLTGQVVKEAANTSAGQQEQERVDGLKELQRMFGASANRMRQEATAFFEMMGRGLFTDANTGQQLAQAIAESPLSRNPAFIAAFSKAFQAMGEGDLLESELGDTTLMHRDSLESERARLLEQKLTKPNTFTASEQQRLDRIYSQLDRMGNGSGRRVA